MDFYTNVVRYGNNLLIREVKNGQRVNSKLKYKPTMFVPVMKQTNWKTLDGKYVTPIEHESIKECSEWLKSYESQPHYIYGNPQHAYTYISTQYPNEITVNKNGIPNDPRSFVETSGIRIGTAAETTRGHGADWFRDLTKKIIDILS